MAHVRFQPTLHGQTTARRHPLAYGSGAGLSRAASSCVHRSQRWGERAAVRFAEPGRSRSATSRTPSSGEPRVASPRRAGFDADRLALARQVHGADVDRGHGGLIGRRRRGRRPRDGASRAQAIAILTADCTPVIVAGDSVRRDRSRGLAWTRRRSDRGGDRTRSAKPHAAWVGPCDPACCYEVGPEVIDALSSSGTSRRGRRHVDPRRGRARRPARSGSGRRSSAAPTLHACGRRTTSPTVAMADHRPTRRVRLDPRYDDAADASAEYLAAIAAGSIGATRGSRRRRTSPCRGVEDLSARRDRGRVRCRRESISARTAPRS